jgi:hypothetical protein
MSGREWIPTAPFLAFCEVQLGCNPQALVTLGDPRLYDVPLRRCVGGMSRGRDRSVG